MKTTKALLLGALLLLIVLLVSLVGCADETETTTPTPTPSDFRTFSKYGFSFEYPKNFIVNEMGMLESEASDASGMVQVGVENGEASYFTVSWLKTLQYSVEGGLEGSFAGVAAEEGIERVDRGELVEATKAGHQMLYQDYVATDTQGDEACGVIAVLYCDERGTAFGLNTVNTTISTKEDALEDFLNYLDSFVCH